ncbi:MAG: DUF4390 domain-containing protein [Pseudomonadota bacterium]
MINPELEINCNVYKRLGEKYSYLWQATVLLVFCMCVPLFPVQAQQGEPKEGAFSVRIAQTRLVDTIYYLDATFDYELSTEAELALDSSVPLTIVIEIELFREQNYWWDDKLKTIEQRYEIKFQSFGRQYVLKSLHEDNKRRFFSRLDEVFRALGRISIPLVPAEQLDNASSYVARVTTYLDVDALPSSLQTMSLFSEQWDIRSQPLQCSVSP